MALLLLRINSVKFGWFYWFCVEVLDFMCRIGELTDCLHGALTVVCLGAHRLDGCKVYRFRLWLHVPNSGLRERPRILVFFNET